MLGFTKPITTDPLDCRLVRCRRPRQPTQFCLQLRTFLTSSILGIGSPQPVKSQNLFTAAGSPSQPARPNIFVTLPAAAASKPCHRELRMKNDMRPRLAWFFDALKRLFLEVLLTSTYARKQR